MHLSTRRRQRKLYPIIEARFEEPTVEQTRQRQSALYPWNYFGARKTAADKLVTENARCDGVHFVTEIPGAAVSRICRSVAIENARQWQSLYVPPFCACYWRIWKITE